MSIVIPGMKFPVADELLVIRSDGTCTKYHAQSAAFREDGKTSRPTMIATLHAHGRLIDADAYIEMMESECDIKSQLDPIILAVCRGGIKRMDTIIPAEEE